jgi:hypothetical protein
MVVDRTYNDYWEALGEFVSSFSQLEVNLQLALWQFAKLPKTVARAWLSSSTRINEAMNQISKLAEAQGWEDAKKKELKLLIDQLGMINKVRNDLLH